MSDESEELELTPERATPLHVVVAGLALFAEVTQAVANFAGTVTLTGARHLMQKRIDREFKEIVRHYDDPNCIGSGSTEPKD